MVSSKAAENSLPLSLIVCRNFSQHDQLLHLISSDHKNYVIVSDDIRIHQLYLNHANVKKIGWISQLDTFFDVSDNVVSIIKNLNSWLQINLKVDNDLKKLIYFPIHCDGNSVSQSVLDFLLLERSYEVILKNDIFENVIIIDNRICDWENDLLLEMCAKINLPVKIINRTFSYVRFKNFLWIKAKPKLVSILVTFRIILIKAYHSIFLDYKKNQESGKIAIQLVGNSKNHLNHTLELYWALKKEKLDPIILGWHLSSSAFKIRRKKIKNFELESFVDIHEIFLVWFGVLVGLLNFKKEIKNFSLNNNLSLHSKTLNSKLINSISDFYLNELLSRVLLQRASKKYFKKNKILALRPHSLVLPVGAILFHELMKVQPKAATFIQGGWPYNSPEPISDNEEPIPRNQVWYFASSRLHRFVLINKGFLRKNIAVNGLHWTKSINDFSLKISKQKSRTLLNLPEASYFILLDINAINSGYLTAQEQQLVLINILNFARINNNCFVLIKPHPTSQSPYDDFLINSYSLPNVKKIDKFILPYHAINASDLLITKFSTLAIEAMYLNVPAIGIILDEEKAWEVYDDGIEYCHSINELLIKLQSFINDPDARLKWNVKMKNRQNNFFLEHGIPASKKPSEILARKLKKKLFENS